MSITHRTTTAVIGSVQWNETHDVDAAALRAALNVADGATANASDAALRDRATHTGSQAISTVSGLQDALDGKLADADLDTLAKLNALIADATLLASSAFATVATTGAYSDLTGTPSLATLPSADQKAALNAANAPSAGNAVATMADIGAGGGGTVMSVGISGSDGIEVDSGSPVTASGTIALGVNAIALRTHLNVESGATANATDAHLLARANHTGTQAAGTITGLATVATSGAYSDLSGSPSIPTALADLDTTVTGTQLNADHAKLSLIENEATADQSAAEVPVTLTATNYSAATADVEAHLTGINTALGSLGGGHDAVTVTDSSSIDFTLTGQALTAVVLPAGVNHDALAGFVPAEHIDWTTDQGATNLHAGNIPDLSATYQGYDADTAKLNAAQTWTALQSFTTVQGAVTTKTATATETIPLDGRMHILTLADGQATVITGTATTAGQYATLVLIGSPAGTGSITWAAGHVAMNGQVLNPAAGAYTDFALDSPDGTTIRYRGVGVEP